MESHPVPNEIPDDVDSRFRFVLIAAHRAEQLMRGAQPRVEGPVEKHTTTAMREVRDGVVDWGYGPPPVEEEAYLAEGEDEVYEEIGE